MTLAGGIGASLVTGVWAIGALCCLIAAGWLQRRRERLGPAYSAVIAAAALTGLWAGAGALSGISSATTALAESARNLGWLFALYSLFAIDGRDAAMRPVRPMVLALGFVELLQGSIWLWLIVQGPGGGSLALFFKTLTMFHLLVAIGALVLLHNLYGGASSQAQRILLWPCTAMALLWIFDLNLYAIGYLSGSPPMVLAVVRGVLTLPVAALLVLNGMAQGGTTARFRPSRAVTFQSVSLLLIGGYLVVLVAASQWLALAGSDYAASLQLALVSAAATAGLVVLPSRRLRGWLRVTVAKHLFQHRYDYRSEWLRFTRTIGENSGDRTSLEERVIRAVADITDSPAGLLLTPSEAGPFELAASWQWPMAEVPAEALNPVAVRAIEACAYVADLDALRHGTADQVTPLLPAWLLAEPRAWALVPLLHYERMVGAVVLARPLHARALDWEDFDLLRVAGQQLASYLAEHSGQAALAEAARFDDFHRRIAFVMHDIKNLASQMGLLARNAEQHAENPEFRADMLVTLRNSADKLNALLARLSRYGGTAIAALAPVRADDVAQAVTEQLSSRHRVILVECEPVEVSAERGSLEQVLLHLVQNAIDASPADAPVFVRVASEGLHGIIEVTDSGTGMSPEFVRRRLFKPFDSTKPGGFGIGAYEARELVRAMQGRLEVESREGLGTRFTVRLPRADAAQLINTLAADGKEEKRVA